MGRGYPRERVAPFYWPYLSEMFLSRLFKESKILALFLVAGIFGQLFFILNCQEQFPFLLYGMYSQPLSKDSLIETPVILIDGTPTNHFSDLKQEMLLSPMKAQGSGKSSAWVAFYHEKLGFTSAEQMPETQFQEWYSQHLNRLSGEPSKAVNIGLARINRDLDIQITPLELEDE